jgi:hypothetical protein
MRKREKKQSAEAGAVTGEKEACECGQRAWWLNGGVFVWLRYF